MGGTVRVLTIHGIPINVHVSWLVIYGLITWTLAVGYFPRALPDLPAAAYWANGLLAAFLLFVSVLLHELSHSFVAMAHGLSVRGITLHVFGGVSHLEDEPPSPRAEFLIAVVGPISSFAIAAVLWAINASGLVQPAWAQAVIAYLVLVNVVVGIFNLVPGFPLDGGRLLRAALWKWKGSLGPATYMASHPAALHRHRIGRQRKADHRDAGRRVLARGIGDQSVGRIHRLQEVTERGALEPFQHHPIVGAGHVRRDQTNRGHISPDHDARRTTAAAVGG